VALKPADMSVDRLAARLRTGTPAVVGRVQQDRLLLDLRSVLPRQDVQLVAAVGALVEKKAEASSGRQPGDDGDSTDQPSPD
jgi:L-seryl-tRNA(Ser) seleniumtransferase